MTKLPLSILSQGGGGSRRNEKQMLKVFLEYFYCKHKQPVIVISMSQSLFPIFGFGIWMSMRGRGNQ